jgi:hypothetical protein
MKFFNKIKSYFDKGGMRRPDFWAIFTMVFALVGIITGEIAIVGLALLPAFFAGFYLSIDTWDDEEGPEDEDETASPDPDYQLYA